MDKVAIILKRATTPYFFTVVVKILNVMSTRKCDSWIRLTLQRVDGIYDLWRMARNLKAAPVSSKYFSNRIWRKDRKSVV